MLSVTASIAAIVSFLSAFQAVFVRPAGSPLVVIWLSNSFPIEVTAAVSVRSRVVPAVLLSLTTSTTELSAKAKASALEAPAPSRVALKADTVVINCCATFSAAKASAALTPEA